MPLHLRRTQTHPCQRSASSFRTLTPPYWADTACFFALQRSLRGLRSTACRARSFVCPSSWVAVYLCQFLRGPLAAHASCLAAGTCARVPRDRREHADCALAGRVSHATGRTLTGLLSHILMRCSQSRNTSDTQLNRGYR